jgi:class 3 adenylate cyclase
VTITGSAPPVRGHQLPFTVGIHRGRAVRSHVGSTERRDNTLIGEAVNIAARLQAACPPGAVLASCAALDGASVNRTGRKRTLRLKGVQDPVVAQLFT